MILVYLTLGIFLAYCMYELYKEGVAWKDTYNQNQPLSTITMERIRRAFQDTDQDR